MFDMHATCHFSPPPQFWIAHDWALNSDWSLQYNIVETADTRLHLLYIGENF